MPEALNARGFPLKGGSEVTVLIAGAGLQGLINAHKLIDKEGVSSKDFVLVDKAGGYGGTWYWNRYPGVACDVEGYSYVPLLEETGYIPKKRYCDGHEIREQCERIAETFHMQGQFCTAITHQQWDDNTKRWIVSLDQDFGPKHSPRHVQFRIRAQFLINSATVLLKPRIPKLNGVKTFWEAPNKQVMHTARWDWTVSGGSPEKMDMTGLEGKRVGIIGTGATALQVVPQIAKWAKHLYVFQRTPAYVGPQVQEETDPVEWEEMTANKGWQFDRMASFDGNCVAKEGNVDLLKDGWTDVPSIHAIMGTDTEKIVQPGKEDEHYQTMIALDLPWAEKMRARVDATVQDPKTAESLKAWYPGFCKRPGFKDDYLSLFNEPRVTLVHTDGLGVQKYTPKGVIASGQEYELDVLILATGYITSFRDSSPSTIMGAPIIGKGGLSLKDKWDSPDFGTLFGIMTNGFPNWFMASISQGGLSHNATSVFHTASRVISHTIGQALAKGNSGGHAEVEVTKTAEEAHTARVKERARWFVALPACTPSYVNGEGEMQEFGKMSKEDEDFGFARSPWPQGIIHFREMTEAWCTKGSLEGVDLRG